LPCGRKREKAKISCFITQRKKQKEKIIKGTFSALILLAVLGSFSLLYARDSHLTDAYMERDYDLDARVNLNPAPMRPDNDGRALGDVLMTIDLDSIGYPGDGYDNAGLSWDGTFLYLVNMFDNSVYVIDPTGPVIITTIPLPYGLYWGLGHESNLWSTEGISNICYEIGMGNFFPTGATFADVSEWWTDGELWLLSVGGTNKMFKFSIPDGTLLDSLGDPTWTSVSQRGLTYDPNNNKFWIGGWNSNMVWEVDPATGAPTRQFPFNSVAGMAYDWQSSLHPSPVLWIATNEATNYIYMVDVANPPVGIEHPEHTDAIVSLSQNVPNPVNAGITTLYYTTPVNAHVTLTIYNVAGQPVKTLINGRVPGGRQSAIWDCTDNAGNPVPSGVYLYRLTSQETSLLKRLVVIRSRT
jgi:YVTN family beta-propeller protein